MSDVRSEAILEAMPETASATAGHGRTDAFARLTPFGWRGGLAVIFAGLVLSFFLAGYFVIYWRNADMDFMVVYNALAMNDGKPQAFFDHPAYFTILSVKLWFQLMHGLGLLDAWTLSAIPSATDVPAFDAAMTSAVRAGRIVALLTATLFVGLYAATIRYVIRDWRVALLAVFAFAYSGGVGVQIRILRSEMIAGGLFAIALLILVAIARRPAAWRPLAMAAAAAMCMLGLENKVQIVLLLTTLPLLIQPFGSNGSHAFWNNSPRAWIATLAAAIAAAVGFMLALPLIRAGIDPATITAEHLRPLLGGAFRIQIVLLIWIGAGMVAYALLWRISLTEALAAICAVIGGASFALLALYLKYDIGNVAAVINPLEKMLVFAVSDANSGQLPSAFQMLTTGMISVLKRYTFVLFSSPRPAVFLVWFVLPGIVLAWRRGERQAAIQALLLMGAAFCIDIAGVRRGLKSEYFIFTDPLIILAGALLLDRLTDLRFARWTYACGVFLLAAHGILSQAEAIKHVFKRSGPDYICTWNQDYQPELPMPWCELPKKRV